MTNFSTKETVETFEMGEDTIKLGLRPLKRGTMLKLIPYMQDSAGGVEALVSMYEIQGVAAEIFPEHVSVIESTITVDDEPLKVEHIVNEVPFTQLCTSVILKLAHISRLTTADSKNSKGPSISTKPDA